jgi:hypothetical protein
MSPDVVGDLLPRGPSHPPPRVAMSPDVVGDLLPRGPSHPPPLEEMIEYSNDVLGANDKLVGNVRMNT